jgi:hypothetical protein
MPQNDTDDVGTCCVTPFLTRMFNKLKQANSDLGLNSGTVHT